MRLTLSWSVRTPGACIREPGESPNPARRRKWLVQSMVYTRHTVDRCLRYAFEYTGKRGRERTLTLCGKTNVLTYVYDLWERAFHEMGESDFPDVKREYAHVDAITMWMVKNPEWFDVIVTGNMFGDIITDLGAMVQGGMGIAAGGNLNPEGVSMFEPIGGSAPKYTGKNVINPLACILAGPDDARPSGRNRSGRAGRNGLHVLPGVGCPSRSFRNRDSGSGIVHFGDW